MRKIVTIVLLVGGVVATALAQEPYKILFWNLENLFDTVDDPNIRDEEFTPKGAKAWDEARYQLKLEHIARVLTDVAASDQIYPAVIGFAEVENRTVLEDMTALQDLAQHAYRIVHYDSPDPRGIDVALIYRPDQFQFEGSCAVKADVPQLPKFRTRDILTVWGAINAEPFYFMVVHWPSRRGGKEASELKRMALGRQMRRLADSVRLQNPQTKIVAMGDFNDDPIDSSMEEALGAKGDIKRVAVGDLFNPYYELLRAGMGTLAYEGVWNLFDNVVVSENLITSTQGGLKLQKPAGSPYYGAIFCPDYLIQYTGRYRGYPLRTYEEDAFLAGFSDHLPVYIYLAK